MISEYEKKYTPISLLLPSQKLDSHSNNQIYIIQSVILHEIMGILEKMNYI